MVRRCGALGRTATTAVVVGLVLLLDAVNEWSIYWLPSYIGWTCQDVMSSLVCLLPPVSHVCCFYRRFPCNHERCCLLLYPLSLGKRRRFTNIRQRFLDDRKRKRRLDRQTSVVTFKKGKWCSVFKGSSTDRKFGRHTILNSTFRLKVARRILTPFEVRNLAYSSSWDDALSFPILTSITRCMHKLGTEWCPLGQESAASYIDGTDIYSQLCDDPTLRSDEK